MGLGIMSIIGVERCPLFRSFQFSA